MAPEYSERDCVSCHRPFTPTAPGQDECISCLINPRVERRVKTMSIEGRKPCEKPGCDNTFIPGPRQRQRLYCDKHFVGHKSSDRKKNTHRGTARPRRTDPVEEKRPAVLRGFIGGVDPKILSRMSVVSDAMVQIDFTDDSLTFRSPGIRLVIGK